MSASSKKKLRSEQGAAKMTERQLAEQKEEKKVKIYSITFVAILVLMLTVAVIYGVSQGVSNSGVKERSTVAYTVGEHELNNAEFNYFYIDAVNDFARQYGSYAAMFGLDVTKPLNEQIVNEEEGLTWADDFMNSAKENAKSIFALVDAANAAGHTLSEEEIERVDMLMSNMDTYAQMSGQGTAKNYLKAVYGNGASVDSYREYLTNTVLADSYQRAYADSLTYEDSVLREAESENFNAFSSFTYNQYYMSVNSFLSGGTTDEEGNTTYSDEETKAAEAAAEEAAKSLVSDEIKSVEDLDKAIAALPFNADGVNAASSALIDNPYSAIGSTVVDWITDEARKEGDVTYIPSLSTKADESGAETSTLAGYYIVYYISTNDNTFPLINARHILVKFEGGTTDETGATVYSDEEKALARSQAEDLLQMWMDGEANEDSFAALATGNSMDQGSAENGGLYEDIYPGQMVPEFEDWCFDASRKIGDTGIVETTYGYHVMFFSGESEQNFRDFQIKNQLMNQDVAEWYQGLVDAAVTADGDVSYVSTDLIIGGY